MDDRTLSYITRKLLERAEHLSSIGYSVYIPLSGDYNVIPFLIVTDNSRTIFIDAQGGKDFIISIPVSTKTKQLVTFALGRYVTADKSVHSTIQATDDNIRKVLHMMDGNRIALMKYLPRFNPQQHFLVRGWDAFRRLCDKHYRIISYKSYLEINNSNSRINDFKPHQSQSNRFGGELPF